MMYFVKVYITYKDSVLDPQGEAVKKAVHRMGYETIDTVIETICDKLLANVNMETYRYEIKKMEEV